MHHYHHLHHHEDIKEEGRKNSSKKMKMSKKCMDKDDSKKCGSYMPENTSTSGIPSLEEWKKSVASMIDPKIFDKKFDGLTNINEALGSSVNRAIEKTGTAASRTSASQSATKNFAISMLKQLFNQYKRQNPNFTFVQIKSLMNKHLAAANNQLQSEVDAEKE